MEDSQVIVQTTCSVSLSTEGSIIPFTPGDVYLCASDNTDATDLWCLVVLHKRNFPRKYSIVRQLTKITIRKRGHNIGFIVIEFDDTNQVRLKDFLSAPEYIASVLEYCYKHKSSPDLVEKLKSGEVQQQLSDNFHTRTMCNGKRPSGSEKQPILILSSSSQSSSPQSSQGSVTEIKVKAPVIESATFMDSFRKSTRKKGFLKRGIDTGCITPPVRCIASIEETRVINEADVEEIPEEEQVYQNSLQRVSRSSSQCTNKGRSSRGTASADNSLSSASVSPAQSLKNGETIQNGDVVEVSQNVDIASIISSHGSTPPREFTISEFEPNNCQADITVSSLSPEREYNPNVQQTSDYFGKINKLSDYPKYSTFNFPTSSPTSYNSTSTVYSNLEFVRRSKRRLTSTTRKAASDIGGVMTGHQYLSHQKERRRILSDGYKQQNIPCKRNLITHPSKRSRLRSSSSVDFSDRALFTHYFPQFNKNAVFENSYLSSVSDKTTEIPSKQQSQHPVISIGARKGDNSKIEPGSNRHERQDDQYSLPRMLDFDEPFTENHVQNNGLITHEHDYNYQDGDVQNGVDNLNIQHNDDSNNSQNTGLDETNSHPGHDIPGSQFLNKNACLFDCQPDEIYKHTNGTEAVCSDEVINENMSETTPVTNGATSIITMNGDDCHSGLDTSDSLKENQISGEKSKSNKRKLRPRSEPPTTVVPPTAGSTEKSVTLKEKVKEKVKVKENALINVLGNPSPHGFINLGNTCYMNCVLQCILTMPSFARMLHSHAILPTPNLFSSLALLLKCKGTVGGAKEKKDLLVKIKNYVTEATSLFKGHRQQDAHEFLGKFLDVLREERRNSLKCPVFRTFQCEVIHTLRCSACRVGGQKKEQYYDFSLNLPTRNLQPHNLATLLDSYFATDIVEYVCSGCGHNSAQVQHRFSQLPEALVLHVQRYAFARGGSREGKRQDSINIPSKLDITKLGKDSMKGAGARVTIPAETGRTLRTRSKGLYSLHGVVSHLGESRECGHYICDVREGGQWYFYDDVNMHLVDLQYVCTKRKNSCYIFFYLRDDV